MSRTVVMGILNITPDSFADGGKHLSKEDAVSGGRRLVVEGADIIDVGGESTRPGAERVSEEDPAHTASFACCALGLSSVNSLGCL